jgi:hypothetical protein
MATVEGLKKELADCLSAITSAGLGNLDSGNVAKLEKIYAEADDAGIKEGKKLIENLITILKAFKDGSAKEDSVQVRLTALDFYLKSIQDGSTEDI